MKVAVEKDFFRDHLPTADDQGKRIWLYPKNSKGKLTRYRSVIAYVLLALMFSGPFLRIHGEPVLLLNILERKFIIFGKIFWPQDFQIFMLVMIAFVIFIALFTIVFGRVFCGWICPQTIFMESVFRKIEYWIEGDYKSRMLLDKRKTDLNKIFKKSLKHVIFFAISFMISNIFLSYILGSDKVLQLVKVNPFEQTGTFSALLIFTGVFYWIYTSFREQVCTVVCPYGRLQGVLLDKKSLVVAYDHVRGETRGKFNKQEDRILADKGDCIDCHQCVNVCPTGIDIRNGTQLECINCTACIDACDAMMEGVGLKKGLIRIDSEESISSGKKFKIDLRMGAYSTVLLILLLFIFSMLAFRSDVETSMLRTPGTLYQTLPESKFSNLYTLKLINKTNRSIAVKVKILSIEGSLNLIGKDLIVPAQGMAQTAAFIVLKQKDIHQMKTRIKLGVYENENLLETLSTTFIGPQNVNY